jgi:hypothetical protein
MKHLRRLFLLLTLLAWSVLGLAPATARAETALSGLEGLGAIVDDSELATMRGKYVTPQGIAYFGLDMTSSWQGPDGITTSARLVFNVDFAGGRNATPQIYVTWKRDEGDKAMDVSGPVPSGQQTAAAGSVSVPAGGGLDTVHGAVQSQLIAGADNKVTNGMTIQVSSDPAQRPDTAGMTPVSGGSTQQFSDGDKLQFVISGSEVGIRMTNGPSDSIRQGVDANLNQLSQQVTLGSSFNDIANTLGLTIGVDPATKVNQINASGAMSAMHGIGF